MKRALTLAERGAGTTHPNPMVGAVVVARGKIVGEGWHRKPGDPHAEVIALEAAGEDARGGSLYVNLEPCAHSGRTPPCTKTIIDAGIKHVFAACMDPHPLVDGKGFDTLVNAGVTVHKGILGREAEELNRAFFHFAREGSPYVTLKLASTLDGRIASSDGDSKWITGDKARKVVHRLRAQVDAILVGVGTVIADDPQLTVRGVRRRNQPWRIVLDPALRTPVDSMILREDTAGSALLIIGENVPENKCESYRNRGVELVRLRIEEGFFPWSIVSRFIIEKGILHILVEGGGETAAFLIKENAVNRLELFLASKILGASGVPVIGDLGKSRLQEASIMSYRRIRRIGEDIQITADIK